MTKNEIFIEKAKKIHGEKYFYDKINYINNRTKIIITCKIHGDFNQTPSKHIYRNQGCAKCGRIETTRKQTKDIDIFINQAKAKHNNKYNYSNSKYINRKIPIEIICEKHGSFYQIAGNHLSGAECPTCAGNQLKTKDLFEQQAKEKHNNKYTYENFKYINGYTKSFITCPDHGDFNQSASNHLSGRGCNDCGNITIGNKLRSNKEDFIKKSISVHRDRYIYSEVEYKNIDHLVNIICKKHGLFQVTPYNHLYCNGGCQKCVFTVSNPEIKWLDSLNIPEEYRQYKITIGSKRFRFDGFDPETKTVYEYYGNFWHGNPEIYNPKDINNATKTTFGELYLKTMEKERILKEFGYKIISKWG